MLVFNKLFDDQKDAIHAYNALRNDDFLGSNVSLVTVASRNALSDNDTRYAQTNGMLIGGAIGAAMGILTALTMASIDDPYALAAGITYGVLSGGFMGFLVGNMVSMLRSAGMEEAKAALYTQAIKRGCFLVSMHCQNADREAVESRMAQYKTINLWQRYRAYRKDGWEYADNAQTPYSLKQKIHERAHIHALQS